MFSPPHTWTMAALSGFECQVVGFGKLERVVRLNPPVSNVRKVWEDGGFQSCLTIWQALLKKQKAKNSVKAHPNCFMIYNFKRRESIETVLFFRVNRPDAMTSGRLLSSLELAQVLKLSRENCPDILFPGQSFDISHVSPSTLHLSSPVVWFKIHFHVTHIESSHKDIHNILLLESLTVCATYSIAAWCPLYWIMYTE